MLVLTCTKPYVNNRQLCRTDCLPSSAATVVEGERLVSPGWLADALRRQWRACAREGVRMDEAATTLRSFGAQRVVGTCVSELVRLPGGVVLGVDPQMLRSGVASGFRHAVVLAGGAVSQRSPTDGVWAFDEFDTLFILDPASEGRSEHFAQDVEAAHICAGREALWIPPRQPRA